MKKFRFKSKLKLRFSDKVTGPVSPIGFPRAELAGDKTYPAFEY